MPQISCRGQDHNVVALARVSGRTRRPLVVGPTVDRDQPDPREIAREIGPDWDLAAFALREGRGAGDHSNLCDDEDSIPI